MSKQPKVRWGAALIGAFLSEAIMIALVIPLQRYGQDAITIMALIGSFLLPMLFGIWVGRRAQTHYVLNGFLVGAFAVVIYLATTEAARRFGPPQPPQPFAYTIAHGLKLLGGALGGFIASRAPAARAKPETI
ncbi:MAG TPA: TIGR04086 family membrane protein [Gammaproteobacteria bacterium]|nr:TIGR04086 family membrane protein [Gammaproteobacteria bacterium]